HSNPFIYSHIFSSYFRKNRLFWAFSHFQSSYSSYHFPNKNQYCVKTIPYFTTFAPYYIIIYVIVTSFFLGGLQMKPTYKKTIFACYLGYVIQAIVNNFIPLLFLTFQEEYEISITKITMLITLNFMIQLVVDLTSAHFIDKIGYRTAALL